MERFMIEETGDDELGFTWDIKEVHDGKLIQVATFYSEAKAWEFLGARRWMESLAEFKMMGEVEGFSISPTGKVTRKRPRPAQDQTKKKAPK